MLVYADNAATTALSPAALAAMTPVLEQVYGNPSSLHQIGQAAAERLNAARKSIADALGAKPQEIYFTSGGTEADNWAIRNAAQNGKRQGKTHIVSTKFEHHAVLHTLKKLEGEGFSVTLLDVNKTGVVRPEQVAAALRDDTCLVTVMYANNEIGTIQPIEEIGALCRARHVPFHTDAVQAVGHLPIDVEREHIDLLSLSGHKFHGPKGIGALYCRSCIPLRPLIEGGAQERGKRAGTENLAAIVGMAAALSESVGHMEDSARSVSALRDRLIAGLESLEAVRLNGDRSRRLPGNVNVSVEGVEGESLLMLLDAQGVCCSTGSACASGSLDPSHVLLAIGVPVEVAHGSLRFSLSETNTEAEVDYILKVLPPIIARLRSMSPVWKARSA